MRTIVEFDTVIGTSNLGDDIIYQSLREELDFLYADSFVMRFGTHVKNLPLYGYYFGNAKLDYAYHADFKIIMGTNILSRDIRRTQAQWPIGNMDSWLYKDCILAGVGTTFGKGPVTPHSRKIYHRILRKDFYHSVRDEESKELLESMGFKALNTGCPTLWKLKPEFCRQIPTHKSDKVIFSLSGYKGQQNRAKDGMLLNILKRNYQELIFWCQTSQDEAYLDTFEGTEEIRRIYSLKQYAAVLDEGNIDYVGTRLHGGVFALQHKVRSIVIAIDHRARGFHETNGLVICEREEIQDKLEQMIRSDFTTEIHLPEKEIQQFKDQFRKEYPNRTIETHDKYLLVKATKFWGNGVKKAARNGKKRLSHIRKSGKGKLKKLGKSIYIPTVFAKKMKEMPVQKGQILFFTFQGEYTCNPKYISEEIFRQKLPWKQIWVTLKDPKKVADHFPENVKLVQFNSTEYYRAMATSEVWIDNAFNFPKGYLQKKPGQLCIETMHGSLGIKKIGPDVVRNPNRNRKGRKCGKISDLCLSNSTFENMVYETSFWKKDSIVMTGHARNDIFFRDEAFRDSIRNKVFKYYGLNAQDTSIRLAMYAPTFRNEDESSEYEALKTEELKTALEARFGGNWYILWRAHRSGSAAPEGLQEPYVLNAQQYPDIQELMIAIDFGITDYSSWIFDYVLSGKNGALYVPDLEKYDMTRGFYYPIQEAPFPLAKTNEEMANAIRSFDERIFQENVKTFLEARGCMDDGHASERIVNLIREKINS